MSDGATPLLGVPNFSEGRDAALVNELVDTVAANARVLDVHTDGEHNRSVVTASGSDEQIGAALAAIAAACVERLDMRGHQGLHPRVGALDICPVVHRTPEDADRAAVVARGVADAVAALGVPVFFYGALAANEERRERFFFRRGGPAELARRIESGEVPPDAGPAHMHESAGATLITARPPIAAFNVLLDTPNPEIARGIAGQLRERGGGLPGVRAIGLPMGGGFAQVSTNVHDPVAVPLAKVVAEIQGLAELHGIGLASAEVVGLVPQAAMEGFPGDLPISGFDPERHIIERALASDR